MDLRFVLVYICRMGQIIIELPGKINRRYLLEDTEAVALLLRGLEQAARRVKTNPDATAEDLADARAAKRARKGELVGWETAKAFLDTLD